MLLVMLGFVLCVLAVDFYAACGKMITVSEQRTCQSAIYYYGVVSTETVCPPELALIPGHTICTKEATNKLCGDGTDIHHFNCDPMVDIYRATDYHNPFVKKESDHHLLSERYPVQFLLDDENDPAYQHSTDSRRQHVYKVHDNNVKPEHCATLVAAVRDRDRDDSGRKIYNVADVWVERRKVFDKLTYWHTTKLPLPWESGVDVGEWFLYSKIYNTLATDIRINVTYLVRYEQAHVIADDYDFYTHMFNDTTLEKDGLAHLRKYNVNARSLFLRTHRLVCYRTAEFRRGDLPMFANDETCDGDD